MRRSIALLTAGLLAVALAAGCGDESGSAPAEPAVDIGQLDVGAYATKPVRYGNPESPEAARYFEAQRMANHIPPAIDVDPAFTHQKGGFPFLRTDARDFEADAAGLITGYATEARSREDDSIAVTLRTWVMLFPDEATATRAATALAATQLAANPDNEAVPIGKYPQAHSHWRPEYSQLRTWYASSRFVIATDLVDYAKVQLKTRDIPALVRLTEQNIAVLTRGLAGFQPTPADKLAATPIDPDRVLEYAVTRRGADGEGAQSWVYRGPTVYDGAGAVHAAGDAAAARKIFTDNGVDRVAFDGGYVFRARDAAAAQRVRDWESALGRDFKPAEAPKNLPSARCKESRKIAGTGSVRFVCVVAVGRFAATAVSPQLVDVQQRISAQYALLGAIK